MSQFCVMLIASGKIHCRHSQKKWGCYFNKQVTSSTLIKIASHFDTVTQKTSMPACSYVCFFSRNYILQRGIYFVSFWLWNDSFLLFSLPVRCKGRWSLCPYNVKVDDWCNGDGKKSPLQHGNACLTICAVLEWEPHHRQPRWVHIMFLFLAANFCTCTFPCVTIHTLKA